MVAKKTSKTKSKNKKETLKSLKEKIKSLDIELIEYQEEIDKKADKNIRLLAEFDNYKRRSQEERSKLLKYAGEDLVKSILPILDDLHRTLDSSDKSSSQSILDGIKLIVNKLDKILEDAGIKSFDSIGNNFDPDLHEALMSEKSDKEDNIILKEFEKGYKYGDKILRHAKVVVSKS